MDRFASSLRQSPLGGLTASLIFALAVGVGAGLVSASGNLNLIVIAGGLVVASGMLMSRRALLWFVVLGGLVVVGFAQLYFPETRYLRYVVPIAGLGLVLHGVHDRLTVSREFGKAPYAGIWPWAVAFLAVSLLSLLVNLTPLGTAIMGLKGYFQMWPFLLGLILVRWNEEILASIPRMLLFVAFLQLPVVIHQWLVLVPMREALGAVPVGFTPVDVIAGTFGATKFGGGANAVLSLYMILVVACLAGLWKHGVLSAFRATLLSAPLLAPLLLNHTKITVLYIPLVFAVLFYRDLARHPLKFLGAIGGMLGLIAALLTAMTMTKSDSRMDSWSELIDFTIERQTTSISERRGQYSELSRWTALTFWAEQHVRENPVFALIGHGPGASRVQEEGLDLADTLAEERYGGLQIGYTALSALLWDTGLVGLGITLALFFSAFRAAGALGRHYRGRDPARAGLFDGIQAGVAVLVLSLAHKDFYAFHIPYQTLIVLLFGLLVIYQQQILKAEASDENLGK